jgi:nicotinamide mononucleotide transporter
MWVFWQERLYGDFYVQILFLIMGIWGWMNWKRVDNKTPTQLSNLSRLIWLLVAICSIPLTSYYFKHYTDCSFPVAEATILNLSILGQALTAMRKIENWLFWVAADLMMAIVYSMKELYPTALYASIIFFIGIFGWIRWKKLT